MPTGTFPEIDYRLMVARLALNMASIEYKIVVISHHVFGNSSNRHFSRPRQQLNYEGVAVISYSNVGPIKISKRVRNEYGKHV